MLAALRQSSTDVALIIVIDWVPSLRQRQQLPLRVDTACLIFYQLTLDHFSRRPILPNR